MHVYKENLYDPNRCSFVFDNRHKLIKLQQFDYLSRWGLSPDNAGLFHECTTVYTLCEFNVPPDMFYFPHQSLILNYLLICYPGSSLIVHLDHEARCIQQQAIASDTWRNPDTQIRTMYYSVYSLPLSTYRYLTMILYAT